MYPRYLRLRYFILFFCFLLLVVIPPLRGLDPQKKITQYRLRNWDMEAGLPANSIYAITQTHDGYLWLGTQEGLVRFDGDNPDLQSLEKDTRFLHHVEVKALHEDQDQVLWIGTYADGLFFLKNGEFTPFTTDNPDAFIRISSIDQDRWGNLWVGSFDFGLTCIMADRWITYTEADGLPSNGVNAISRDGNQDLWITTTKGIVKIIGPENFKVWASHEDLPHDKDVCLYEADSGVLWIGTGDKYLFSFKNGQYSHYGPEHEIYYSTINCLFRDGDKNLWIGTDGGGLIRNSKGDFSAFRKGTELAGSSIYAIYEDREKNLWIGTHNRGLFQLRVASFTPFTTKEGLAHDDIQCLYEDRTGNIWFGSKGGLCRLNRADGKISNILSKAEGLLDDSVTALHGGKGNSLWIGTWGGLHLLEEEGKLTTFTRADGLSSNNINCIRMDRQGNTWVGTENGLNRIDSDRKIISYTTGDGLTGNSVRFIYQDIDDNLLIGTGSGLNGFKEGKIIPDPFPGMGKRAFSCIYRDKEGVIWLGTDAGLIMVKDRKSSLFIFTTDDGLVENYVESILEDDNDFLWLAGRNGISRIKKKQLEDYALKQETQLQPVQFTELDGMKSRWCNEQAIKTRDGSFWFPTSIGAAVIHPNHIEEQFTSLHPIIEKVTADGVPVFIHGMKRKNSPVKLKPGTRRLEFFYTAPTFINPKKITFKSFLENYDSDWFSMGKLRVATYTELSPGTYTFKVAAVNPDKPDELLPQYIDSFSVYQEPAFTQTLGFYLILLALIITAAFLLYRMRISRLKAREKQLEALVAARTADLHERNAQLEKARQNLQNSNELIETKNLQLESQTAQLKEQSEKLKEMDRIKNRFFTNISHEFRTPLTLIMGPLEQMLVESNSQENRRKLGLMLRNSQRLLGLINQLLELSRFESGKVKLQANRQNIIPLLKGIVGNFEALAEQRELELKFHSRCREVSLFVEPAKIQEVMENLLINAVKFTPPGGEINVSVSCIPGEDPEKPGECLRISISDTGAGIPREQLLHIFDRFYQSDATFEHRRQGTGIGLALVKELVQLHHGTIDVYSHEGKGTEFIISLPMGDSHLQPEEIAQSPAPSESESLSPPVDTASIHPLRPPAGKLENQAAPSVNLKETSGNNRFDPLKPEKELILVIEDNRDVREYIRGAIEPNYRVVEAGNGVEGLQKAREMIPDLIISDIMMPELDGLELCKTLKTDIDTSHIPIILLTARASEAGIVRGLETGADDYITKPFSIRILLARIKNLLEIRRQLQLNLNREMILQPVKDSLSILDKGFLKKLRRAIRKNLEDVDFNVEKLAKELEMDRSTVYRKVLALTGESPTEFIRSCRLRRGAELLKSNFGTVLEVALEVGFSSANYFSKCFKKKFQQLPSEYQAAESE